jgi:DNA invertase Pin-like site-specific DNA recombinase|tara:strand:- start:4097 stop:4657 length:561 start_codon:yes stop_codon:yes gene_type:complete
MSFIGYARVSTRDQDLTNQIDALKAAGCEEVFHGKQSGASTENEEKLAEMVRYIRKGDVVVVTKLDRLGRSLKSILSVIDEIHAKQATLKSLDGSVDTSNDSPFAKAQIALLGTFAQLERDLIVSRTSEGRKRAMKEGRKFGRPPALSNEQKKKVKEKYQAGKSKNKLSKEYGVSRATIARVVGKA